MTTIAIISQKGGAGKTTLAVHLAAEADHAGQVALVIDTDPQASAYQWGRWREGEAPEVIDSPPALLPEKIERARAMGADFIVIDTPPHAEAAAIMAASLADLVLIPCRPSALDLHAVKLTADLMSRRNQKGFVVFSAAHPSAARLLDEAAQIVRGYGLEVAPPIIAERAAYRHALAAGQVAREYEPKGKAAEEMRAFWTWANKAAR